MSHSSRDRSGQAKLFGLLLLASLITLLLGAEHLFSLGSVVVRDADDSVAAVFLRDSEHQVVARLLPGNVYATTAKLEGEAIIRCRTGKRISLGYVTGGWHISQTVRAADCTRSAPTFLNS